MATDRPVGLSRSLTLRSGFFRRLKAVRRPGPAAVTLTKGMSSARFTVPHSRERSAIPRRVTGDTEPLICLADNLRRSSLRAYEAAQIPMVSTSRTSPSVSVVLLDVRQVEAYHVAGMP